MENRAKPKKKSGKKKIPMKGDPRTGSRGKVAKVSRKRSRGDNSGDYGVPDEVYERHLSKIDSTAKAMEKAKEAFDQAKGVHQSAYKAAKGDGCDIDAIRLARRLDKQDAGVTHTTYANVSRVLNLMGSPLGDKQLDLFGHIATPVSDGKKDDDAEGKDAFLQGEGAGKNAEPVENNPFTPGSLKFGQWAAGYEKGQQHNREKFLPN